MIGLRLKRIRNAEWLVIGGDDAVLRVREA